MVVGEVEDPPLARRPEAPDEPREHRHVRAAEPVDRLLQVADRDERRSGGLARPREQVEELLLQRVHVLVLVDEQRPEPPAELRAQRRVAREEVAREDEQVVEVRRARLALARGVARLRLLDEPRELLLLWPGEPVRLEPAHLVGEGAERVARLAQRLVALPEPRPVRRLLEVAEPRRRFVDCGATPRGLDRHPRARHLLEEPPGARAARCAGEGEEVPRRRAEPLPGAPERGRVRRGHGDRARVAARRARADELGDEPGEPAARVARRAPR